LSPRAPGSGRCGCGIATPDGRVATAPFANAALATGGGRRFAGANVENASYGLAICAERVAAVKAVTAGARDLVAIAVVSSSPAPTPPCGACRQFLYEFNPGIAVVSEGGDGGRERWRLSELLPDGFGPQDLEVPR